MSDLLSLLLSSPAQEEGGAQVLREALERAAALSWGASSQEAEEREPSLPGPSELEAGTNREGAAPRAPESPSPGQPGDAPAEARALEADNELELTAAEALLALLPTAYEDPHHRALLWTLAAQQGEGARSDDLGFLGPGSLAELSSHWGTAAAFQRLSGDTPVQWVAGAASAAGGAAPPPMEQVFLDPGSTRAGFSLDQLDRAMERDARRYDHGFSLR